MKTAFRAVALLRCTLRGCNTQQTLPDAVRATLRATDATSATNENGVLRTPAQTNHRRLLVHVRMPTAGNSI